MSPPCQSGGVRRTSVRPRHQKRGAPRLGAATAIRDHRRVRVSCPARRRGSTGCELQLSSLQKPPRKPTPSRISWAATGSCGSHACCKRSLYRDAVRAHVRDRRPLRRASGARARSKRGECRDRDGPHGERATRPPAHGERWRRPPRDRSQRVSWVLERELADAWNPSAHAVPSLGGRRSVLSRRRARRCAAIDHYRCRPRGVGCTGRFVWRFVADGPTRRRESRGR